ncbi:49425a7a-c500-48da-8952-3b8c7ecc8bb7 [Sclerotinia trifoliorum]|uniref:49425a7a-c500-48da-8952-3b8c7ecc8bb7 n=1 Tax=Sclerotinia trifoliorum TaxID=28548 RepID=A0A8H2W497_9HELO|nr:49425a7a-c500-48da-8952-3b8c7ecc8bb7 [Sclerotinia trifoliorum]
MRFSIATIIAFVAIANAAALPVAAPEAAVGDANAVVESSVDTYFSGQFNGAGALVSKDADEVNQALQKRDPATITVLAIAGVAAIAKLTEIAIELASQTLANVQKWNPAREAFTRKTTLEMWNRNPDYNKYPAVACYNKGYHLQNPSGQAGRVSVKLELGLLHTNYDCLFMTGNNVFITHSEGGYINVRNHFYKKTNATILLTHN